MGYLDCYQIFSSKYNGSIFYSNLVIRINKVFEVAK